MFNGPIGATFPTVVGAINAKLGQSCRNPEIDNQLAGIIARPDPPIVRKIIGKSIRNGLGKFHPGQKLNATFVAASIVVMLATGSTMHWFEHFSDDWRTGATFVHDWFALGIGLSAAGHIAFALSDPDAFGGMVRGWVPRKWAQAKRARWLAEVDAESGDRGDAVGDVVARAE